MKDRLRRDVIDDERVFVIDAVVIDGLFRFLLSLIESSMNVLLDCFCFVIFWVIFCEKNSYL